VRAGCGDGDGAARAFLRDLTALLAARTRDFAAAIAAHIPAAATAPAAADSADACAPPSDAADLDERIASADAAANGPESAGVDGDDLDNDIGDIGNSTAPSLPPSPLAHGLALALRLVLCEVRAAPSGLRAWRRDIDGALGAAAALQTLALRVVAAAGDSEGDDGEDVGCASGRVDCGDLPASNSVGSYARVGSVAPALVVGAWLATRECAAVGAAAVTTLPLRGSGGDWLVRGASLARLLRLCLGAMKSLRHVGSIAATSDALTAAARAALRSPCEHLAALPAAALHELLAAPLGERAFILRRG
jgi:hypothetical protein